MLCVLLYLVFSIIKNENKQYLIREYKSELKYWIEQVKDDNKKGKNTLVYKNTSAYKNKIQKEEQWYIAKKWEKVVYFTYKNNFDIFSKSLAENALIEDKILHSQEYIMSTMTHYEKWIYFILKKDIH